MRAPLKTGLAFATSVLTLAIVHHWVAAKGLSPTLFSEVLRFQAIRPHRSAPADAALPAQAIPAHGTQPPETANTLKTGPTAVTPHPALADYLFDETGALDTFYARLAGIDGQGTAPDAPPVAILHYGDSPTTADLITGDVRALLQKQFGDSGHGYLLIAKPWAWYGHRDTDISAHGWTISTAVGKMRAETYGIGGASFDGTPGAASHITLKDAGQTSMELSYLAQPAGGTVAITGNDGQPMATIDTAGDERRPAWQSVALPPGTRSIDIKPVSGHVTLFGETFLRQQRGVLYDSLGLNGASTTVLSRGFAPEIWSAELQHDAPALVIINYGTNESSFGSFVDRQYETELRTAIQRIRNALPNVSILVMSPMDRGERSGIDQIDTMPTIPRIVAIQKRVAADTHCAFFDTFNAMGGDGTMSRWYTGKPRLVAADLIHPTPQGASIIAQVFVKNLIQGYDQYKAQQTPSAPDVKKAARS